MHVVDVVCIPTLMTATRDGVVEARPIDRTTSRIYDINVVRPGVPLESG